MESCSLELAWNTLYRNWTIMFLKDTFTVIAEIPYSLNVSPLSEGYTLLLSFDASFLSMQIYYISNNTKTRAYSCRLAQFLFSSLHRTAGEFSIFNYTNMTKQVPRGR